MATQSSIEWTEQTWNPTTGCTKISLGCKNCYAEIMARRLHAMGTPGYENEFELTLHPLRLEQPIKRKKPTVYFVNSMSDLFHEHVSDEFLDRVFDVIRKTPYHTYQILTKRADRLPQYFHERSCPKNVWLECRLKTSDTAYRVSIIYGRWKLISGFCPSSRYLKM